MEKGKTKVVGIAIFIVVIILGWFLFSKFLVSKLDGTGKVTFDNSKQGSSQVTEILFVGDIMLDRTVRTTIERNGFDYLFEDVKGIFEGVDLAVGNLEGAITENPSLSQANHEVLRFTFATSTAFDLKRLGFTHVSLANNHALDFGEFGLSDTEHYLTNASLYFFGSPFNERNSLSMPIVQEEKICFLGYHSLYDSSTASIMSELSKATNFCDFIVMVTHWGDEYELEPNEEQVSVGRAFIDAGVDLIIGSHPHVVQPVEIYKGKAIFYSLGNFVFDQDFSLATRQGLAVRLELSEKTQKFHLIAIEMEGNKLYFPEHEAYESVRQILISKLPSPHKEFVETDGVLELDR